MSLSEERAALSALKMQAAASSDDQLAQIFEGASHLLSAVVRNNPHQTWRQIVRRPEIQQFWQQARQQFHDTMQEQFSAAQGASEALVRQTVAQRLGIAPADVVFDSSYFTAARARMEQRMEEFLTFDRLQEAFEGVAPPLSYHEGGKSTNVNKELGELRAAALREQVAKQERELRYRTRLGVTSSIQRMYTEALRQSAPVGMKFMWVAQLVDNTPCGTCLALHGTVVSSGQVFSASKSYDPHPPAVFGGPLVGPPRHPNCKCMLIPVDEPVPVKPVRPTTKMVSARHIRAMPKGKFWSFLAGLQVLFSQAAKKWQKWVGK